MNSKKIIFKSNYYSFKNIPLKKDLDKYYKKKYFKINKSYNYKLSIEEKKYHFNNTRLKYIFLKSITKRKKITKVLEIGAGQGQFANSLLKINKKLKITAVDYSKKNFLFHKNKNLKFIESDPEKFLDDKHQFDVVFFNNVVEHVPNPQKLIRTLKKNFNKNCLFCITIPNDFSKLQNFFLKKKIIKNKYWISYPEHLNYFSKINFLKFLKSHKINTLMTYAEFPIEIFLFNKNINYIKNKKFGKFAHDIRCKFLNYLFEHNDIKNIIDLHKSFSKNEIGRDNIFFIKF